MEPEAGTSPGSLPFPIELAIPYLSASVDLHSFAAVSKAFCDAARASYQLRIQNKRKANVFGIQPSSQGEETGADTRGDIFSKAKIFCCPYISPWWIVHEEKKCCYGLQVKVELDDNGNLVFDPSMEDTICAFPINTKQWKLLLLAPHRRLLFGSGFTELVYWSLVGQKLLLHLRRWKPHQGTKEIFGREYLVHKSHMQLVAVMYQLPSQHVTTTLDHPVQLSPLFCLTLTEQMEVESVTYDYDVGQATRSRDGKVLAVITALPDPLPDPLSDPYLLMWNLRPREAPRVTVFDISETGLQKRCVLPTPIGD